MKHNYLKPRMVLVGIRIMLVFLSLFCGVISAEFILRLSSTLHQHKGDNSNVIQKNSTRTPDPLAKYDVDFPGATKAYMWQGVLHVFNEIGIRRTSPILPKKNGVFRIVIYGDSFTYGQGVGDNETYSSQIEQHLMKKYNVEVINYGILGAQSEDVLKNIETSLEELKPDLVIYGVCLNDYLPSKHLEYDNNFAYKIPIPEKWKAFITNYSYTGRLMQQTYNNILTRVGLRNDFLVDIYRKYNSNQSRFASDVKKMNLIVTKQGLPPIVAMVLNHIPRSEGISYEMSMITEQYLRSAGMKVISTWRYLHTHNGEIMTVNSWEQHPNTNAHAIFSEYFLQYITAMPQLTKFKK